MSTMDEARAHFAAVTPVEKAMQAAKVAFNAATKHPSTADRVMELDADYRSVRRQAALLRSPGVGAPRYAEEKALWEQAERRWAGYANGGMPPRQPPGPDPLTVDRQRKAVAQHMNILGSRGVHLSISESGELIARPSVLLNEYDKKRLAESKALFVELLQQEFRI